MSWERKLLADFAWAVRWLANAVIVGTILGAGVAAFRMVAGI